jgi:crotonobetainyl-CoA:carnitine CoA-transferase CaiB-like acyl-CoA transferase
MTKDGRWVALSGAAQKPFERLMEVAGHPEMNEDPRFKTNEERIKDENRKVINQVISEWIGGLDFKEVLEICDRLGATVGPVANMADIAEDPHYEVRGSWTRVEDPVTKTILNMPNVPFQILGSPGRVRFPGLPPGSANEVIYQELLGLSIEEINELKKSGAI